MALGPHAHWRRRLHSVLIALVVTAASSASTGSARAEPSSEDRAAALVLFDEGRRLMGEGRYDVACPKLAESLRLAAGPGTRFNLAECYERTGRLASAWQLYREVAAEMAHAGDAGREKASNDRAGALEPRLSRLVIEVAERVPGLSITRSGRQVGEPLWGTPVPVDAGSYVVEARAPGYVTQRHDVQIEGERGTVRVTVTRLARASAGGGVDGGSDATTADGLAEPDDGPSVVAAGWSMLGVGLTVSIVGIGLMGGGFSMTAEADEDCPTRVGCTSEAEALGNKGRSLVGAGLIMIGPAAITTITGLSLLIFDATRDDGEAPGAASTALGRWRASGTGPQLSVAVGPASASLRLRW